MCSTGTGVGVSSKHSPERRGSQPEAYDLRHSLASLHFAEGLNPAEFASPHRLANGANK
jgi:hypothetical protein